ncbi:MAG: UDP-N-acetylmuramate--L-alanine ligase [bacterium]
MKNFFKKAKSIHFIGIGGIGISAVARMFLLENKKVSGSDISESKVVKELKKFDAKIFIGHLASNIPKNIDLIIYTTAITQDNPELIEAKKRKIKIFTYPESLKEISKNKFTIAISGTHGKTTTTAMIAKIMIDAGLDPTVIVGSFLKDYESNFIAGKSKYFVVEACEYRKSFLNIKPTIALITNIDNDHLDFYKDIEDIQCAFKEFALQIKKGGHLIINIKKNIFNLENLKTNIIHSKNYFENKLKLKAPGKHNKENASFAFAVADILGIDKMKARKSLEDFSGTWRRFEYKGKTKSGALVYDDYAHHPTEIKATLSGTREFFGKKKIFVVFQPHLYSRTKILLNDFAKVFKDADEIVLAPIYAAREKFDSSISSEILVKKTKNTKAISLNNFDEIEKYLLKKLKKENVLITIGAGDVYKIGEKLVWN